MRSARARFKLPGLPSRIPQRDEHVRRAVAAADGLEHVLGCGEAHVVADGECGLPVAEGPVQHESAVELHGSAEVDRRLAERLVGKGNVDLLEQGRELHVDRPVDDDTQRAVLVVLAHIGERVRKIRVRHGRHGDEEVVREIDRAGHQRRIVIRRGVGDNQKTPASGNLRSCSAGCRDFPRSVPNPMPTFRHDFVWLRCCCWRRFPPSRSPPRQD